MNRGLLQLAKLVEQLVDVAVGDSKGEVADENLTWPRGNPALVLGKATLKLSIH